MVIGNHSYVGLLQKKKEQMGKKKQINIWKVPAHWQTILTNNKTCAERDKIDITNIGTGIKLHWNKSKGTLRAGPYTNNL